MLKPEIEKALNRQMNMEQTAAQEYLAMAAYCERRNFRGFAAYMRRQSDEEREHAMRLFDYLFDRGGAARLGAIGEPSGDFDSPKAVFDAAFARERANTASIHALYRLAVDHQDYATQTMLHWFIDEQVEEERWCDEAVALLETVGDNPGALLMLDSRYGKKAAEKA